MNGSTAEQSPAATAPATLQSPTVDHSAQAAEQPSAAKLGLVLPEGVTLMLDTALHGDRAENGTPGQQGRLRSKNLTVLVGTIRTVTNARGINRRITTGLGATEYRYELSINEIVGDELSAARSSYRLPISMNDAVRARAEHLLQDGQRIALLGPLGMEAYYDQRFQQDAYDAGRRTWDIRVDVLGIQEVEDSVPDMAWVQLEGEIVDRPRIYARQFGDRRSLTEWYAGVTLRYREVLASSHGVAVRPVIKSVPIEILVSHDEEIIANSDALLRQGNKVRIEGRLSPITFQLSRSARTDASVQSAMERTRSQIESRNNNPAQRANTRQMSTSADAIEQQVLRAQQRLLTGRRLRVEVGYVELLHGTAVSADERRQLLQEQEERRRSRRANASPDIPSQSERTQALDLSTRDVMQTERDLAEVQRTQTDEPTTGSPPGNRPRRIREQRSDQQGNEPTAF